MKYLLKQNISMYYYVIRNGAKSFHLLSIMFLFSGSYNTGLSLHGSVDSDSQYYKTFPRRKALDLSVL